MKALGVGLGAFAFHDVEVLQAGLRCARAAGHRRRPRCSPSDAGCRRLAHLDQPLRGHRRSGGQRALTGSTLGRCPPSPNRPSRSARARWSRRCATASTMACCGTWRPARPSSASSGACWSSTRTACSTALAADLGKPRRRGLRGRHRLHRHARSAGSSKHLDRWVKPALGRRPAAWPGPARPGSSRAAGRGARHRPVELPRASCCWPRPRPRWRPATLSCSSPRRSSGHTAAALAELVPRVPRRAGGRRGDRRGRGDHRAPRRALRPHLLHRQRAGRPGGHGRLRRSTSLPVTLELGGKSPAIVAADANVEVAARRIAWAKFLNAGQTCVAPDYVLVDRTVETRAARTARCRGRGASTATIRRPAPTTPASSTTATSRRLTEPARRRWLRRRSCAAASTTGPRATSLPPCSPGSSPARPVMGEEIFGPLLPVLAVDRRRRGDRVRERAGQAAGPVRLRRGRPPPTGWSSARRPEACASTTPCCTSRVPELPFGGVGESGTGAYHGRAGFERFSHLKAVLAKPTRPDPPVLYPAVHPAQALAPPPRRVRPRLP